MDEFKEVTRHALKGRGRRSSQASFVHRPPLWASSSATRCVPLPPAGHPMASMSGTRLRTAIAEETVFHSGAQTCLSANGAKESALGGPSLGECCPGNLRMPTFLRKDRALNGRRRAWPASKAAKHSADLFDSSPALLQSAALSKTARCHKNPGLAPWADSCGPLAHQRQHLAFRHFSWIDSALFRFNPTPLLQVVFRCFPSSSSYSSSLSGRKSKRRRKRRISGSRG